MKLIIKNVTMIVNRIKNTHTHTNGFFYCQFIYCRTELISVINKISIDAKHQRASGISVKRALNGVT